MTGEGLRRKLSCKDEGSSAKLTGGTKKKHEENLRDFRLPLRCKWDLLSSGTLRSVYKYLVMDVSVQLVGHILKGQQTAWPLKM
jgi:hypothetical protein